MRLRLVGPLVAASAVLSLFVACGSSSSSSATGISGPQIVPAANTDPDACAPATGYACCDGDFEGTWTCSADGGTVCQSGTALTALNNCTSAFDSGAELAGDAETVNMDASDASDAAPEDMADAASD